MRDIRETLNKVLHHRACVPVCVGVGSVSAGLGAGYALGRYLTHKKYETRREEVARNENQMELDFEAVAQEAWHEAFGNERDQQIAKAVEAEHPSTLPPHLKEVHPPDEVEEVKVVELPHKPDIRPATTNVFRVSNEEWDQAHEESLRTEDRVYILSKDEFFADERSDDGYLQESMVYFEGDDILTDSSDVPQYDYSRMVGDLRFGHGSGEAHTLYVRNPMLKMEYEITKDPGYYEHEVLGDRLLQDDSDQTPRFHPDE